MSDIKKQVEELLGRINNYQATTSFQYDRATRVEALLPILREYQRLQAAHERMWKAGNDMAAYLEDTTDDVCDLIGAWDRALEPLDTTRR